MIKKVSQFLKGLSPIYTETLLIKESFIDFASRFANYFGTVILLSGGNIDSGRYNIMGYNPWLILYGKDRRIKLTIDNKDIEFEADPFEVLRKILQICKIDEEKQPIISGLMGYLSYDFKNNIEELPLTTLDDLYLPDFCFFIHSIIVVHDKVGNKVNLFVSSSKEGASNNQKIAIDDFKKKLSIPLVENQENFGDKIILNSNLKRREYIKCVKKIRQYISEGDVYQVNMSQRFETPFRGNSFSLFRELYKVNPAPFFAYINDYNCRIVSSSPERLVMQKRNKVEARPIKGTRPRGRNIEADKLMKEELLCSVKDDAELSMIVDLLRNDLGKVCKKSTVSVSKHKKLETYNNVYHLVSIVKGELAKNKDTIDLIKAVFPGGSITGCPKVRAMEIIDELEVNQRHIYTGSIGYISFHNTMDLSVAIRTATVCKNRLFFSVGGGIVYDSDPNDEYRETLHKGQSIMRVLNTGNYRNSHEMDSSSYVWFNGAIKPLDRVKIGIQDLGLLYGFGLFETIYVEKGKIFLLNEHIHRFNNSWEKLFNIPIPKLTWDIIINQVIDSNNFLNENVVVKIIATRGDLINDSSFNGSIIVTGEIYKKRSFTNEKFLKVGIYRKGRESPLASHKTTNYLYYYFAGFWAKKCGFDEAIILNPDGTVSEGNSTNLILIYKKLVIIPKSNFVLKGIMLNFVIDQLKNMKYEVVIRKVDQKKLFVADAIFLTNSLIGLVPIFSINNKPVAYNPGLAGKLV